MTSNVERQTASESYSCPNCGSKRLNRRVVQVVTVDIPGSDDYKLCCCVMFSCEDCTATPELCIQVHDDAAESSWRYWTPVEAVGEQARE